MFLPLPDAVAHGIRVVCRQRTVTGGLGGSQRSPAVVGGTPGSGRSGGHWRTCGPRYQLRRNIAMIRAMSMRPWSDCWELGLHGVEVLHVRVKKAAEAEVGRDAGIA